MNRNPGWGRIPKLNQYVDVLHSQVTKLTSYVYPTNMTYFEFDESRSLRLILGSLLSAHTSIIEPHYHNRCHVSTAHVSAVVADVSINKVYKVSGG